MNQILSTGNNYKQKTPNSNNAIDMRKIIIIFSVLLIAFALIVVGAVIFGIVREKSKDKDKPITLLNRPTISVEEIEKTAIIKIIYDEGLDKISYWWNDGENAEERKDTDMHGATAEKIIQISVPSGENNILHVQAIGTDGSINEVEKKFGVKDSESSRKPSISWYHYEGTTKMDITVTSSRGVQSLTYNWENEEEVTVNSTEEKQKELKVTIDVKRGTNRLYIKAVDIDGNKQTKDGIIKGTMKPDFNVKLENYKTLKINVIHDKGFKKVVFKINGQEYVYDENNPNYKKETINLNISTDVPAGQLNVEISAYTLEEENKEYTYKASTVIPE